MKFTNTLGRRAVSTVGSEFVTLETTEGGFKMGSVVSEQLGVKDGDALQVVEGQDEDGMPNGVIYIGKGKAGVPMLDENGKEQVDGRGRTMYEEGQEPQGATIRNINENGAYQRFAGAAAWATLGGSNDVKKVYKLGEGVDATLETENGTLTTTLYPLEYVKDEAKIIRKKKEDGAEESEEEAEERAALEADNGFRTPGSEFNDEEL